MTFVPEPFQDLLRDDVPALAYLATLMPDGTPQVTPLWFNADEECILINSARGRIKDRNMRARSAVAVCIQDPKVDTRYIQVRGLVIEVIEEGALDHIDQLSMKYRHRHWTPVEGQVRVTYRIRPVSVFADE